MCSSTGVQTFDLEINSKNMKDLIIMDLPTRPYQMAPFFHSYSSFVEKAFAFREMYFQGWMEIEPGSSRISSRGFQQLGHVVKGVSVAQSLV